MKKSKNKVKLWVQLNEITQSIFAGCLCVVMASSQTVMAHNVPRKIGQQFSSFFLCFCTRTKVQTRLLFFALSFNWLWWMCLLYSHKVWFYLQMRRKSLWLLESNIDNEINTFPEDYSYLQSCTETVILFHCN